MSESSGENSFGHVVAVRGAQAKVGLRIADLSGRLGHGATVGGFVSVRCWASTVVAMITEISRGRATEVEDCDIIANVDFLGEITEAGFQRGVSRYPVIGDRVELTSRADLHSVYAPTGSEQIEVGHLQQDNSIAAYVDVDEMLNKHFALLGSTGVGKSTGVSLLLNGVLEARPEQRIFLLDVHNEYGRCFGDKAHVLNPRNLKLPFWLFNFEEIVDVLFGRRPGEPEELEILTELIPIAKSVYAKSAHHDPDRASLRRADATPTGFTSETPVPYRITDLISQIDACMGKLENRSSRLVYYKLIARIEKVRNDPRYAFMFENANLGGDTMAEVISQVFRLPARGKPITVMQLAGFPVEVIDSVVSVLCRMAFDFGLWSDGASKLLIVCEEAHRYASADRNSGFGPTRKAVSRVAKEGRKYGVYLGLVSQRPAELDATILSQCSTLFAMRLTNDSDQALLRAAAPDAAENLLSFLPSLGSREVLAFGEGVTLPTRLRFKNLPAEQLPRGEALSSELPAFGEHDLAFIEEVVARWRGATLPKDLVLEQAQEKLQQPHHLRAEDSMSSPALSPTLQRNNLGLDPERFRLLKRPVP